MRKILFIIICLSSILLYSCANREISDVTTSTQSISTAKTTQQNNTTSEKTTEEITTVNIPIAPENPYSVFIKNRYREIYEAQKGEGANHFYKFDKHALDAFYFLYDLDGDSVDELLLGSWIRITDDFDDSSAPRKILITSIYTIENGKVVNLDDQAPGSWNWYNSDIMLDKCILSNGLIMQATDSKECPTLYYYYVKDGELRLKYGLFAHINSDGSKVFAYRDENSTEGYEFISEEEYIRLRDEANGDAEVVEINWKRIDEYGR